MIFVSRMKVKDLEQQKQRLVEQVTRETNTDCVVIFTPVRTC